MNNLKTEGRKSILIIMAMMLLMIPWSMAHPLPASAADKTIDTIIAGVEARYNVPGFTADFDQESILKAMAVTDTASGRLMVRQQTRCSFH